jgi:hypothetical protein
MINSIGILFKSKNIFFKNNKNKAMQLLTTTLFLILIASCNNKPETQEESFRKNHLFFGADSTYNIKIGSTIAFGYSETEGIDRSRFPAPSYGRDLDTAFFKFVESKSFYPEGCAGCARRYYSIFKAIQKGTTNITETKTTYKQEAKEMSAPEDTTIVVGKYVVNIK